MLPSLSENARVVGSRDREPRLLVQDELWQHRRRTFDTQASLLDTFLQFSISQPIERT
jgi:hypothetical protein